MDETKLETLVNELGLSDNYMADQIQAEAAKQGISSIVGALSDPFTRLLDICLVGAWLLVMAAFRLLIPQLYLRYATGHWLDEQGLDNGLERDLGTKTKLTLDLVKAAGTPLSAPIGTVFYILESSPRRYQTLVDITPLDADTNFTAQVEAICPESLYLDGRAQVFSTAYNAAAGLDWACESQLSFSGITFAGVTDLAGTDPEDDEAYRARIINLRSLKNFLLGGWLYYERLLKTVAGVAQCTLDSADPNTAMMSITLYGETGQVPGATLSEAQALFDAEKMKTDHGVLNAAAPLNIDIELLYKNGGTDAETRQKVADFFQGKMNGTREGIIQGTDFEASDLHDYAQETWPDLKTRITPQSMALPTGNFFTPTTTPGILP